MCEWSVILRTRALYLGQRYYLPFEISAVPQKRLHEDIHNVLPRQTTREIRFAQLLHKTLWPSAPAKRAMKYNSLTRIEWYTFLELCGSRVNDEVEVFLMVVVWVCEEFSKQILIKTFLATNDRSQNISCYITQTRTSRWSRSNRIECNKDLSVMFQFQTKIYSANHFALRRCSLDQCPVSTKMRNCQRTMKNI